LARSSGRKGEREDGYILERLLTLSSSLEGKSGGKKTKGTSVGGILWLILAFIP